MLSVKSRSNATIHAFNAAGVPGSRCSWPNVTSPGHLGPGLAGGFPALNWRSNSGLTSRNHPGPSRGALMTCSCVLYARTQFTPSRSIQVSKVSGKPDRNVAWTYQYLPVVPGARAAAVANASRTCRADRPEGACAVARGALGMGVVPADGTGVLPEDSTTAAVTAAAVVRPRLPVSRT